MAIAIKGGGIYVSGSTDSPPPPPERPNIIDFPIVNALYGALATLESPLDQELDAFVTQILPGGSDTLCVQNICRTFVIPPKIGFSTYLGGGLNDAARGIAVDSNGNIYVTGFTRSSAFPTQKARFPLNSGNGDAFVSRIDGVSSSFTGTFDLNPSDATLAVHERLNSAFTWTVPSPRNWHDLQFLQLRIRDDEGETALFVLFDEASNSFSLFNENTGQFEGRFLPGSRDRLQGRQATLYLAETSVVGSGPAGPSVTLNLSLSFKSKAAGHTFQVEVAASDDLGNRDDFDQAGTVTVTRRQGNDQGDDHVDDHNDDHNDD
jgi:hypothetical protein